MSKELLFSITRKDFKVDYVRGSGKGGQARNKTSNACRITHIRSGAQGYAEDTRSQHQNKELAFRRMFNSDKFQSWYKMEVARRMMSESEIERLVANLMIPSNLKVETWDGTQWVEQ